MKRVRYEPTQRRDRFYWGGSGDPQEGLTFVLVSQLGWPLALVFYLGDLPWEASGLALLFAVAGLLTRHEVGHVSLELWPPRRMLIWDPRGAEIPCEIDELWVRNGGDDQWTVDIRADIPKTADGPAYPTWLLLESSSSYAAACEAAEIWLERLNLPDLEISHQTEEKRPTEPKPRRTIAGFAVNLDQDRTDHLKTDQLKKDQAKKVIDFRGFPFTPAQIFLIAFWCMLMLTSESGLMMLSADDPNPYQNVLVRSWELLLACFALSMIPIVVGRTMRLDFRSGQFELWRGPRFLAKIHPAPFSELQPIIVMEHRDQYGVFIDTGPRLYGLAELEHREEAETLAAHWAERLGIDWVSELDDSE